MNPQSLTAIVATFEPDAVVNIAGVFIVDRDAALMAKVDALGVTWAFAGVERHQAFSLLEQSLAKS